MSDRPVGRALGRTGLQVTRLGFGAMELRGPRVWGGRDVTGVQAHRILGAVVDAGITFIDTANDYGRSETYLGQFLADRRGDLVLATKCGCNLVDVGDHDETPHFWDREHLRSNIDDSLAKLRTDRVDLLQLHNPSVETAEEYGLVESLREIQSAGKARFIGVSSTGRDLSTFIEWGVFDAFQIPYSALEREHEDLITKAHVSGAGTIVRGGIARGEPGRGLGTEDRWATWRAAGLRELMDPWETPTAWLLRFTLTHPAVDTVIVGTLDTTHLEQNLRALSAGPLTEVVYAEAKRRLDAVGECPMDP